MNICNGVELKKVFVIRPAGFSRGIKVTRITSFSLSSKIHCRQPLSLIACSNLKWSPFSNAERHLNPSPSCSPPPRPFTILTRLETSVSVDASRRVRALNTLLSSHQGKHRPKETIRESRAKLIAIGQPSQRWSLFTYFLWIRGEIKIAENTEWRKNLPMHIFSLGFIFYSFFNRSDGPMAVFSTLASHVRRKTAKKLRASISLSLAPFLLYFSPFAVFFRPLLVFLFFISRSSFHYSS